MGGAVSAFLGAFPFFFLRARVRPRVRASVQACVFAFNLLLTPPVPVLLFTVIFHLAFFVFCFCFFPLGGDPELAREEGRGRAVGECVCRVCHHFLFWRTPLGGQKTRRNKRRNQQKSAQKKERTDGIQT